MGVGGLGGRAFLDSAVQGVHNFLGYGVMGGEGTYLFRIWCKGGGSDFFCNDVEGGTETFFGFEKGDMDFFF